MKRYLVKCNNNTDWLSDTDFMILTLHDDEIENIENIQNRLNKCFPENSAEVHIHFIDFEVYSSNTDEKYLPTEIINFINSEDEYKDISNLKWDFSTIPISEDENNARLDTYMLKIYKNTIQCVCYGKHDGSIEVFSSEININEL